MVQRERRSLRPAGFAPIEAKLRPSVRVDGLVFRSTLVDRLLDPPSTGVVLVTAPAGYGKTVLASQWAEDDPRPFVWLSADDRDNDPRVLFTYLMLAFHRTEPVSPEILAAVAGQPDERLPDDVDAQLVRMLRARSSSLNGLMRMPMKGDSDPASTALATSMAADSACPSSSASGRLP